MLYLYNTKNYVFINFFIFLGTLDLFVIKHNNERKN